MKKFRLCSDEKCCPEVTVDGDNIIISDDFGGEVKLTRKQVEILIENLK